MLETTTKPGEGKIASRNAAIAYLGGMLLVLGVGTAFTFMKYYGRTQGRLYVDLALILQPCAIGLLLFDLVHAYQKAITWKRVTRTVLLACMCLWLPTVVKVTFYG
jgi:hypothetical protein